MLKKIEVSQLRLGMHLHAFEGAWIDHPFWRTRFVIDDAADLKKVLASGVRECWIDSAKGLDLPAPEQPSPQPAAVPAAAVAAPVSAAVGAWRARPRPWPKNCSRPRRSANAAAGP
jgi:hypothetical protein